MPSPETRPPYARALGATGGPAPKEMPAGLSPVELRVLLAPSWRAVRILGHYIHSGGLDPERVPMNPDWLIGDTFTNPAQGTVLLESYGVVRGWYEFSIAYSANVVFALLFQVRQGDTPLYTFPFYITTSSQVIRIPGPLPLEFDSRVRLVQNSPGVAGLITVSLHLRQVL